MGEIKDKRLELLIEEVNIFLNNDQLFEHCLAVAKTAEALTEELTDSNERRLASQHFKITDEQVLSAIECHTTLRKNFTELDLIVFLADKISWDGGDNAPFRQGLLTALSVNLQSAALYYIKEFLTPTVS